MLAVLGLGLVDPAAAVAAADDAGLVRGDGCFEGCRLVVDADGATVAKLDRHLARFSRSAAALGIPFDEDGWRQLVAVAAAAWPGTGEAAMKLVLTRGGVAGPVGFARVSGLDSELFRQRREGVRVATLSRGLDSHAFTGAPWLLGGVKTLSYAVNMAAQREAVRRGADDVVFVGTDGVVLEAPTASVVWADGDVLRTTTLEGTGILAGTTQALLFERAGEAGWSVEWTRGSVGDLHEADAVWLVSSVRGPVDVVDIDGHPRPRAADLDGRIRTLAGFPAAPR